MDIKEKVAEYKHKYETSKKISSGTIAKRMQDSIPIAAIRDGVVITKDRRYIKILECNPINFMLRSFSEQSSIIYSFTSMFRIAPVKMQFKVFTKKKDMKRYIETLRQEQAMEPNFDCKLMQEDSINLLESITAQGGVTRRFFIIFEYERAQTEIFGSQTSFKEVASALNIVSRRFVSYMKQCGNEIIQFEPQTQDEDIFLMELFYELLNRKKADTIPFERHSAKIVEKYRKYNLKKNKKDEIPYIPVNQIICPTYMDFTQSNCIVIDGVYYSFLYVPGRSYSVNVASGWTTPLINAGEGIDVDIFFEKQPKENVQAKIGRTIRLTKSNMVDVSDTASNYDSLSNAVASGYYIKSGLSSGEDFYYMSMLITVIAYDKRSLLIRSKEVQNMLRSLDMDAKPCNYKCEEAFYSTLPLCNLDKNLEAKAKRNVLTNTAASSYVFSSFEMCDQNGVLLGTNLHNGSLVVTDIFNSKIYKNANMAILGTSGAGKTYLLQLIAMRMRMKNIQVFIIAPLKGDEFLRACNNMGGQFVKISPGSPNCINIMEIRKADNKNYLKLFGDDKTSILAKKVQQLHIFFRLIFKELSEEEKNLLDEIIMQTYYNFGITNDNSSLLDENNPGKYKTMPIIGDLYKCLDENEYTKRLARILKRYVDGSLSNFNGQTNVNLNNKYIVLDISELTDEMRNIGMFVALDYVWDKSKEDKTQKKAIFLDELWQLIGAKSDAMAAEFVLEIFKIIRGYGGAAIAATQDINDFFALEDGKYGKGIINNAKTKIILQLEEEEKTKVQEILNLSETEGMKLTKFEQGEALISTNNNNVLVKVKASLKEHEMITTDREDLRQQAEA